MEDLLVTGRKSKVEMDKQEVNFFAKKSLFYTKKKKIEFYLRGVIKSSDGLF